MAQDRKGMITSTTDRSQEEERIRHVYAGRDKAGKPSLYAWHRSDVLVTQHGFRLAAASMLAKLGMVSLEGLEVLDIGCGTGAWLRTLAEWGAIPARLHGLDLITDRIEAARRLSPAIDFQAASGWAAPFPAESMDLISAHTVFSSIVDPASRTALAREMVRMLRAKGIIMIYDFRISHPRNPDTLGIRKSEIERLFPDMSYVARSLTLAPPLARRLAPISASLTCLLEAVCPFLRTHALYFLKQKRPIV